jgi:hypothetical protein
MADARRRQRSASARNDLNERVLGESSSIGEAIGGKGESPADANLLAVEPARAKVLDRHACFARSDSYEIAHRLRFE